MKRLNPLLTFGGFSLIELLAVILITSVLALITIPSLSSVGKHLQLRAEFKRLEKFVQYLALESTRRGVPVKLSLTARQYEAETSESSPTYLGFRRLPAAMSLELSGASTNILFHGSGVNSPASIKIIGSSGRCTLTISLRGRVSSRCR